MHEKHKLNFDRVGERFYGILYIYRFITLHLKYLKISSYAISKALSYFVPRLPNDAEHARSFDKSQAVSNW